MNSSSGPARRATSPHSLVPAQGVFRDALGDFSGSRAGAPPQTQPVHGKRDQCDPAIQFQYVGAAKRWRWQGRGCWQWEKEDGVFWPRRGRFSYVGSSGQLQSVAESADQELCRYERQAALLRSRAGCHGERSGDCNPILEIPVLVSFWVEQTRRRSERIRGPARQDPEKTREARPPLIGAEGETGLIKSDFMSISSLGAGSCCVNVEDVLLPFIRRGLQIGSKNMRRTIWRRGIICPPKLFLVRRTRLRRHFRAQIVEVWQSCWRGHLV